MEIIIIVACIFSLGVSTGYAFRGSMHKELAAAKSELHAAVLKIENIFNLGAVPRAQAELLNLAGELRKKL